MRSIKVPLAVLVASAAAACGGGGDEGGFVATQLALVPAGITEGDAPVQVVVTDLARLADLTGAPAPDPARTGDELGSWIGQLTFGISGPGLPKLFGFPTDPLMSRTTWPESDVLRDDTGIALGGVEQIVVADAPPLSFAVTSGDVSLDDALPEVADGVVSFGDGEDLAIGEPNEWNQLGRAVRFAERDGSIAWSLTTDLAAAFAAGDAPSLADRPSFGALAAALDEYDVVSALLAEGEFAAAPIGSGGDVPPALAVAPFAAVALGATVIDDEARTIVAYAFAGEGDATAAVDVIAEAWTDGDDGSGRPLGQQFAVLSSATTGSVAVIELVPVGDANTQGPVVLLFRRASVFTHE